MAEGIVKVYSYDKILEIFPELKTDEVLHKFFFGCAYVYDSPLYIPFTKKLLVVYRDESHELFPGFLSDCYYDLSEEYPKQYLRAKELYSLFEDIEKVFLLWEWEVWT